MTAIRLRPHPFAAGLLGLGALAGACASAAEPPAPPAPVAPEAPDAPEAPAVGKEHKLRIFRTDDGDRVVIVEMDAIADEVRDTVAKAREHAEVMRRQALVHLDKALLNTNRIVIQLDGAGEEAMKALSDTEGKLRGAFNFAWEESLTSELERLEEEIETLSEELARDGKHSEEEFEKLREEREKAMEEAERELEKAEEIRRRALADAAEQIKDAREKLRRQRDQLRAELDKRKTDQ